MLNVQWWWWFSCSVMSNPLDPWTVACQTPLSMEFPRQEYCSQLPFPSPGDLLDPGIKSISPALAGGSFTTEPPGKPLDSSVQFSLSVVSDSLRPHESQHARLPCPSPTPGIYPNSCPLSWWCHPITSFSVAPFSACLQSFPASESFPMSCLLASGGQYIGASALASVLPRNIQDWFPLGWTGLISLKSKGLSRVFSNTTVQSISSSVLSFLYGPTLTSIHDYWKNHSFDCQTDLCWQSNVSVF